MADAGKSGLAALRADAVLQDQVTAIDADPPGWPQAGRWCGPMPYERAKPASNSRSSFLPRLRRDITVPTGSCSTCAISLYENSSTSASRTTAG
jgi:hypothetical protein